MERREIITLRTKLKTAIKSCLFFCLALSGFSRRCKTHKCFPESAGLFSKPKEKPINKPPLDYFYHKQFHLAFILLFLLVSPAFAETGLASFYGNGEKLNVHTANREVFNPQALTCATYNYPFNTILKVTNLKNNKSVIVRVNDRGPNKRLGRAIDLTKQAFLQIASLDEGIIEVKIEKVD